MLPEARPGDARWRIGLAITIGVLAALTSLGLFGAVAALTIVLAVIAIRPTWRAWSAWWRSPQRHSSPVHQELQEGATGDEAEVGDMAVTTAQWQAPPPPLPLVRAGQQRAVATLLAGRWVAGEIDLAATVRALASRRPLSTLPRRPRWSTNQGMQLHVDSRPAIEPFSDDVDVLRQALAAIAAPHAVVMLGFDGDPRVITRPRRLVWPQGRLALADRLPPPGTPVLVVTDLGIAVPRSGSPPEPEAFLEHHRLLVRASCTVHYLVPYPSERWPLPLRELPILYWNDDLGPAEVLTGIRRRARAS